MTTRVSDGVARILVSSNYITKRLDLDHTRVSGTESTSFEEFLAGSLPAHCVQQIDSRIAGLTDQAKLIHNGVSYSNECWASDVDFTFMSREIPRCSAITPRHVLMAEHFQNQGPITFLALDGTVISRNITHRVNIDLDNNFDSYNTDFTIGVLDSDLPASISPVKLPPSNLGDFLPNHAVEETYESKFSGMMPVLRLDQEEKALVGDLEKIDTFVRCRVPLDYRRSVFYEPLVGGDSGGPICLLVNGKAILLGTWTFGGSGIGPSITSLLTEIGEAIDEVDALAGISTGYRPIEVNLTEFTNFGPPKNTTPPSILGNPEVGQTLSTSNGVWAPIPSSFTYAWKRDGVDIEDADDASYTLVPEDLTKEISCEIIAQHPLGPSIPLLTSKISVFPAPPHIFSFGYLSYVQSFITVLEGKADHQGGLQAAEYNFVDVANPWQVYYSFSGLSLGQKVLVSGWVKLGTAPNFALVLNDSSAWNTMGGKTFDASDGLSSQEWTPFFLESTITGTGSCNIHLGTHQQAAQAQQLNGTVFLSGVKLTIISD